MRWCNDGNCRGCPPGFPWSADHMRVTGQLPLVGSYHGINARYPRHREVATRLGYARGAWSHHVAGVNAYLPLPSIADDPSGWLAPWWVWAVLERGLGTRTAVHPLDVTEWCARWGAPYAARHYRLFKARELRALYALGGVRAVCPLLPPIDE